MGMCGDPEGHQRRPHDHEYENPEGTGIPNKVQGNVLNEPLAMASARWVSNVHNVFETKVASGKKGREILACFVKTRTFQGYVRDIPVNQANTASC